jgi:hypothetical protein
MPAYRVLLVCIGALGDLAWRKFIEPALELDRRNANVEVLFVDLGWLGSHVAPLHQELRWRIGRRCIELLAEKIDEGKVPGVRLTFGLESQPLPWEVDDFFENCLTGDAAALAAERERLRNRIEGWVSYFTSESLVTGLPRYASNIEQIGGKIAHLRTRGYKVAAFVATPPQAYPSIIKSWQYLADRIVLEKPACGLNPETLLFEGPDELLRVVAEAPDTVQVVTSDHYNAKAIVRAMDRARIYRLFDGLLDPSRIKRIVVQLLEQAPLPLGRVSFYNGVGGPFGDMVPHLLQAVRAILGLTPAQMRVRFGKSFYWARYDTAPAASSFTRPAGTPYSYDPEYYQSMRPETETFVAFEAEVSAEGGPSFPLYCRTGKGFQKRKSLRVDVDYDGTGSELSLIFDLDKGALTIRDETEGFVLAFGQLSLHDPFESGVPSMAWEYEGIFESLIRSDWTPGALNHRFFPEVEHAAETCRLVYERLVTERQNAGRVILPYSVANPASRFKLLNLLDPKAHWG